MKLEVEVEVPSGGTGRARYGETSKTCETGEAGETGRRFSDPRHPRHPRLKTRSETGGPSAVGPHNIVRGERPRLHRKRVIRGDPCASVVEHLRSETGARLFVSLGVDSWLPGLVRVFREFRGRPRGAGRKAFGRRFPGIIRGETAAATSAEVHAHGHIGNASSVAIRVHPWLNTRGAIRERVYSWPLVSLRGWPARGACLTSVEDGRREEEQAAAIALRGSGYAELEPTTETQTAHRHAAPPHHRVCEV